jgi:hypothetical protein
LLVLTCTITKDERRGSQNKKRRIRTKSPCSPNRWLTCAMPPTASVAKQDCWNLYPFHSEFASIWKAEYKLLQLDRIEMPPELSGDLNNHTEFHNRKFDA